MWWQWGLPEPTCSGLGGATAWPHPGSRWPWRPQCHTPGAATLHLLEEERPPRQPRHPHGSGGHSGTLGLGRMAPQGLRRVGGDPPAPPRDFSMTPSDVFVSWAPSGRAVMKRQSIPAISRERAPGGQLFSTTNSRLHWKRLITELVPGACLTICPRPEQSFPRPGGSIPAWPSGPEMVLQGRTQPEGEALPCEVPTRAPSPSWHLGPGELGV